MRIRLFCHSIASDWNHGNAHFLRGIVTELIVRGHDVRVYEPRDSWSRANLVAERSLEPIRQFQKMYPLIKPRRYDPRRLDVQRELDGADLVIVHEWNAPRLVAEIGRFRQGTSSCRALFHDTHHRSVTDPESMAKYDLSAYDGVLAFGAVIRDIYLRRHWTRRAWAFHEAADVRVFRPLRRARDMRDLVWIGNWGDEERTEELSEFLLEPACSLGLSADIFGVRYPQEVVELLKLRGIRYGGWLANFLVPRQYARHRVTVHVPRRPYARALKGIATIRPFEALACGIPLVSAPWDDCEDLFTPGKDYLVARDGREMKAHLRNVLAKPALAASLAEHGLKTILARHTCSHRVDQLLEICRELDLDVFPETNSGGKLPPRRNAAEAPEVAST